MRDEKTAVHLDSEVSQIWKWTSIIWGPCSLKRKAYKTCISSCDSYDDIATQVHISSEWNELYWQTKKCEQRRIAYIV